MRLFFVKIKDFFKIRGLKPFLIGSIIGVSVGIIVSILFVGNVKQNFHFVGYPNWIRFLNDSTTINESFISIPESSINGSKAYINGDFSAVLMLKKATFEYDSILHFEDLQDSTLVFNDFAKKGKLSFSESEPDYITPMLFSFKGDDFSYVRRAKIKDYSTNGKESNASIKCNGCNADFSLDIPVNNIVTIKSINYDATYSLSKQIPSEFFINTPLPYKHKLFNQFLPEDSCKTLLFSNSSDNNIDIKFGSNKLRSIINGGIVKINNVAYEGDYLISADLTVNCNAVKLSENIERPFDVAISLDNHSNKSSYLGLISSAKYIFLTTPDGSFSIGNQNYKVSRLDKLEMYGDLHLSLMYKGLLLPEVSIEGDIYSCKLNNIELLKSRWERLSSDIRSGIIGGVLGFVLSLITILLNRKTTHN